MSNALLDVDLMDLDRQAIEVQKLLIERFRGERGVRIEDAISAMAGVAGCLLLRSTGVALDALKPGQPVFVDAVNELGAKHFEFLSASCEAVEIDPKGGWTDLVPEEHQPSKTILEFTQLLEGPFLELCDRLEVAADLRVRLAIFTVVRLLRAGREVLDPNVGKAIALTALVAGSKTVPFPRSKSSIWLSTPREL